MNKIKILVVPSDNRGGVGFYRSTQPHIYLEQNYSEEFQIDINMNPDWDNLDNLKQYNIIHVHKGLFQNYGSFRNAIDFCKNNGIVTILDIDDFWELPLHHPNHNSQKTYHTDQFIIDNIKRFNYITTTTPLFAEKIRKFNPNVVVLPNAIDDKDERFQIKKEKCDFLRVGMIMGSAHEYDTALLNDISNKIDKKTLEKIQFVLCGFDLRGTIRTFDQATGQETSRPMKPHESVWYRYEKMLTNNYSIVSPEYKRYLEMFIPNVEFPNAKNEHYRRFWTKPIDKYYQHYANVDVLLAPLEVNTFNYVKSQLKVIECAFSNTAIIASNYGPYTLDLKPMNLFGGQIDREGNAMLVDESKNHKDWARCVTKLANEPELVSILSNNLTKDICGKYSLESVSKERANFYKTITNKTKE